MTPVRPQAGLQEPEMADETAIKRGLDALASGACNEAAFLKAMQAIFQSNPEASWEVLSQLDQYYRLGKIEAEVFQALKKSVAESALGATKPERPVPREAAPRDAAPRDLPLLSEHPVPRASVPREAQPREAAGSRRVAQAREPSVDPPPLDSSIELKPGTILRRRYRLENILGRGHLGTVFEALDEYRLESAPGVHIAIKVLNAGAAKRAELLSEMQQEFQHLQLLSHPNIVRVFEFDRDGPAAFFTMELLDGVSLSRVLDERKFIPLERAQSLAIVRDIGEAIAYAHSRGVVHGDINLQNVFVTVPGDLRILGFAATRALQQRNSAAMDFELTLPFATSGYASIQVLKGEQPATSDDIFALACVAYRLISGAHPFFGRTAFEARQAGVKPQRPPHLNTQQWQALRAGLHWERQGRPTDMQQWLEQLDLRGAAKRVAPVAILLDAPEGKESYSGMNAAAALAVALIIAACFWFVSNRRQPGIDGATADRTSTASTAVTTEQRTAPPPAATDSTVLTAAVTARQRPLPAPRDTSPAASAPATSAPAALAPAALAPAASAPATSAPATSAPATSAPATSAPDALAPAASAPATSAPAEAAPAASSPARIAASAAPSATTPPVSAPPVAVPSGPPRLEMAADTIDVPAGETAAGITVRRKGSLRGETNFTWWTESGTAKPGADFSPVVPQLAYIGDGKSSISLNINLPDTRRTQPKSFYVVIDQSEGGAPTGARTLTMVTLQPPD